ncbi:MAG: hypothetical protein M0Z55_07300 [Peptococcaceae bacterium]|nr:hypothetical protein [Peptococcaceae bacterium]
MSAQASEELHSLQEELEDLIAERQFQLGQTGVHISAKKVIALREYYDKEIGALEQKIKALEGNA